MLLLYVVVDGGVRGQPLGGLDRLQRRRRRRKDRLIRDGSLQSDHNGPISKTRVSGQEDDTGRPSDRQQGGVPQVRASRAHL